jgi:O-antigen ligase
LLLIGPLDFLAARGLNAVQIRNIKRVFRRLNFFKAITVPFWLLVVFLIITFFTGGASRSDVQSLIILRPAAVVFCGLAVWTLRWSYVKKNRFLFGMAVSIFVVVGMHLIPLPPIIWSSLPGRELINEIDGTLNLGSIWRPISMSPPATWNALFSLFVPLAVLLLGVQIKNEERYKLLWVLLAFALFSGFLGILQVIGDPQGPLYLYRITNHGSAVGLFSNRNHQAIFLVTSIPMLTVFACTGINTNEQLNARSYMSLALGLILVPLILITGSRTGLVLAVLVLLSVASLYKKPTITIPKKRTNKKFNFWWFLAVVALLVLTALTIVMSRAEALKRIVSSGQSDDLRFQIWPQLLELGWKYFPFGSGVGSFVEVYQISEPTEMLSPAYVNHAHNDWLELWMTLGLPALILLGIAVVAFVRALPLVFYSNANSHREKTYAKLGAILILLFALGSITDYPLRSPSLSCVFVIACLWLTGKRTPETKTVEVSQRFV